MSMFVMERQEVALRILDHMIQRIECTPAIDTPFSHIYFEEIFPPDIYQELLDQLPDLQWYEGAAERHYGQGGAGYVRSMLKLSKDRLTYLPDEQQVLWRGVAAALTAPELKRAIYNKLHKDLAFRYGVRDSLVGQLAGYTRPTLYSETAGFEIPPHPDTRKKVVTMHLYLPADRSQLNLGTALYRRRWLGWPFGDWRNRFVKVKQFAFQPNSGYAFVVNNSLTRQSWHGRERLPADAGVRNTLLNTFYEYPRDEFDGYFD